MVSRTLRLLVGRRWWWVTVLVLLAIAVMARLSIWQFDRLEERRAANEVLREQLTADPLSLNGVDLDSVELTTMPDRRVQARGTFDFDEQILLQVQNYRGNAGAHLVAPLRLEGQQEAVLVDRGWIPESRSGIDEWGAFDETGVVTIEGVIQLTQTARGVAPPDEPQTHWFRIDVEAIQQQMPYELLPVFIMQAPPQGRNEELPYRVVPDIDLSEGPHLSYALQWAIFALMLGVGYVVFVHRQETGKSDREHDLSPN